VHGSQPSGTKAVTSEGGSSCSPGSRRPRAGKRSLQQLSGE